MGVAGIESAWDLPPVLLTPVKLIDWRLLDD